MTIRLESIKQLTKLLGARETAEIIQMAKTQDTLEARWRKRFEQYIKDATNELLEHSKDSGRLKFSDVDFTDLVMRHSFDVIQKAVTSSERRPAVRGERLAAPPKSKIPLSLRDLRTWWDRYRKRGIVPARQREIADKLKKAYVDKLQSVWEKHGEDFRKGETASTFEAQRQIMKGADVAYSRAKMIVETETTYYYNKTRREVYDQSPDVTHYLFMAIRDFATTKWCKTRHGLVYGKDDPLFEKETPPIHWNCRSEILPLTPLNPTHARIINDKTKQRRQNRCEPLPPGWTGR